MKEAEKIINCSKYWFSEDQKSRTAVVMLVDKKEGNMWSYSEGTTREISHLIYSLMAENKDVNEVITGFESARKALGLKPNTGYEISERIPKFISVAQLVNDINPKHTKALIALNELFTIAEAWNKEDGFVPDFSDWNQDKWFPWFKYDKDVAEFVCTDTINAATAASAHLGSRLCFKSSERAAQFGKQFEDLYNKVFL